MKFSEFHKPTIIPREHQAFSMPSMKRYVRVVGQNLFLGDSCERSSDIAYLVSFMKNSRHLLEIDIAPDFMTIDLLALHNILVKEIYNSNIHQLTVVELWVSEVGNLQINFFNFGNKSRRRSPNNDFINGATLRSNKLNSTVIKNNLF